MESVSNGNFVSHFHAFSEVQRLQKNFPANTLSANDNYRARTRKTKKRRDDEKIRDDVLRFFDEDGRYHGRTDAI